MNLVESISCKVTPASKKERKVPGYWNWPQLIRLVEKALETGEPQQGNIDGMYYAVVTPHYGLIKSAQTPEYLKTHEKVRVALYSLFFTLGVEKGVTIKCPVSDGGYPK